MRILILILLFTLPAYAETVRIGRQLGISYLPLILMQDARLIEREAQARGVALTVEWTVFTGGSPINDALISGNIDLAGGGVGPMLTIWARTRSNLRVKGIASLGTLPVWLNTSNAAVRTIADFTDRDRIAVPGVRSSVQAVVLQMAARQAFGPGQQNRLDALTVSMGHPDGQAVLLGGGTEIDSHFTAAPYMYDELVFPRIHRVLDSYDVLGGPHSFNLVWTTGRYHDANPQVMAVFMAALEKAMLTIINSPQEAAAVWVRTERSRMSIDQAAEMIMRPENEWTTTPRRVMTFMKFMADTGAIPQRAESWRDLFFPELHDKDGG